MYRFLADTVVLVHLGFILYVVFGGLILFWNKKTIWIHVICVFWAAMLEFFGWICPLTYLELWLRNQGGGFIYHTDFIEHYILPIIYPDFLNRPLQVFFGIMVIVINLIVYGWLFWQNQMLGNDSE